MHHTTVTFLARREAEGGFSARAVGHSIFTQAETLPELKESILDAVRCHFDEEDLPSRVQLVVQEAEEVLTV